MKFCVYTLGCKVNQYESTVIISSLKELGHEAVSLFSYADVYIINTCSITAESDKKSRQMIARTLKFNPDAKIIIIGCSSENLPETFKNKNNVIAVFGTNDKIARVIETIEKLQIEMISNPETIEIAADIIERDLFANETSKNVFSIDSGINFRARTYLKIQDGCNNFCSYCIVPYLRGRSRSRTVRELVLEAERLAKTTEELVITGINISAYMDEKDTLGDLIAALKHIPVRKRLGSLECNIITEDFLIKMRDSDFCDHFHLSLQSGSESVLKSMNRHYKPEEFYQKTILIRKIFPSAGITTDIITGYPEETDENHAETLAFVKSVEFSDIHVFPYSKRAGTKAATMRQVDKQIIEGRALDLGVLKNELKLSFYKKNIGKITKVFIEDSEGEYNSGYTSNYIKVFSIADRHSFLGHKLCEIYNINGMKGEIINE